jgi:maltose alpha-D-glucosyltransferase / alpha-amylase
MKKSWYHDAILYGVDVKLFRDSDQNGFGDFAGLSSRVGYLKECGINCLWLMPFFPSPLRDYGYDVSDFLSIDPRLGTMDDFLNFLEHCDRSGIRVLMDLVINHTSIAHPWFIQARTSRDSPYRDYYLWQDEKPANEKKVMFEGVEDSVWAYAPETRSYYLHSYFKEQADLNIGNPQVHKEILRIIKFWLQLGVAGFRIDAAHALVDSYTGNCPAAEAFDEFLGDIRNYVEQINPDAVLLGEADVPADELQTFVGEEGERLQMLFNFFSNQYAMLAMASESAAPLVKGLRLARHVHDVHSVNFIRHHDELNLQQLSSAERRKVLNRFAPKEEMRVFKDQGIVREVGPMLEGDSKRIRLLYTAVFGLPGSPMLHYGEEIGMGDDVQRELREAVRLPMQWSAGLHGGFSEAPLERLCHPPLIEGDYSYRAVNVENSERDPNSLLHFVRRLIECRIACPEIGRSAWSIYPLGSEKVLSILYDSEHEGKLLVLGNFSAAREKVKITRELRGLPAREMLADASYPAVGSTVELGGFGYRWIRFGNASGR